MKQFGISCKKEFLEQWRTGKFLMFSTLASGMAVFSFLIVGIMVLLKKLGLIGDGMGMMGSMFEGTYANVTQFFAVFMSSYFLIILLVMIRSVIDKEISDKKWVLPMQAGVKPSNIILAKFVSYTVSIAGAIVIACAVHFVGSMIFFKLGDRMTAGFVFGKMFKSYLMILITFIFFSVLMIAVNALTRKGWVTVVVTFLVLIIGGEISNVIKIGSSVLTNYSPFLFVKQIGEGLVLMPGMGGLGAPAITWQQWLISSISTISIIAILIFASIKRTSVKSVNIK